MRATMVVGRPAAHARSLRSKAARSMMLIYGTLTVVVGVVMMLIPDASLPAAAAAAASGYVLSAKPRSRYARASAGVAAEDHAARAILRLSPAAVVHGFRPHGRGDVDHLIMGPKAVAVETKHGRGKAELARGGGLVVGGRKLPGDPLEQALRAARSVSEATGRRFDAVVVVSRMSGPPVKAGEVTVCSPSDLAKVTGALPDRLSSTQAREIASSMRQETAGR